MQNLLTIQDHGAIAQAIAAALQLFSQRLISTAIADLQTRDATAQLTEFGEVAAEQAAAIEHQHRLGRGALRQRFRRI